MDISKIQIESGVYNIKDETARLSKIGFYNNVNAMKSDLTLLENMVVKTLGYYSENDGGAGLYKIKTNLTSNNSNIILLDNNLFAELIVGDIVNIKQFGCKGDGTTDDTQKMQIAFNYANTNKCKVFIPKPTSYYLISDTITVNNYIKEIESEYYDYNGVIRGTGSNFTMFDIKGNLGLSIKGLSIGSVNGDSINGILYEGHTGLNHFEHIRVYNLDGFGFKINAIYDSVLDNISVELCGNNNEYAFSMNNDGDTCNMSVINHLQVEQSKYKSIKIDADTLSCVFNDIHSERASNITSDTWIFGGNHCIYNGIRLHSTAVAEVSGASVLTGVENLYNNYLCEQYINTICEGMNGAKITINNSTAESLYEKLNQIGQIYINKSNITKILSRNHVCAQDTKINNLILEFTTADYDGYVKNCKIESVTKLSTECRLKGYNSIINTLISDSVKDIHLIDCTINAFSLSNNRVAYSKFTFDNCIINSSVAVDGSEIICRDSTIIGDLTHVFGPQQKIFKNTKVTGTVGTAFTTTPSFETTYGVTTDNLKAESGSAIGWVYTSTGWKAYGTVA